MILHHYKFLLYMTHTVDLKECSFLLLWRPPRRNLRLQPKFRNSEDRGEDYGTQQLGLLVGADW